MDQINEWLNFPVLGNSLKDYAIAVLFFLVSILVLNRVRKLLMRRLTFFDKKWTLKLNDYIVDLARRHLPPLLYFGAFYFSINQLHLNSAFTKLIDVIGVGVVTIQSIRIFLGISLYLIEQTWFKTETKEGGTPISKSILTIVKVTVWGLGVVFILDNLGFNISAVVAGLGIGGVAVALAAQTILGDLFNYFVIFFDRPFEEGDFVVFEDYMGHIENIGIKSTRIRSIGGEQIVVSNSNLTASKIRNYKRMQQRRIVFTIGVVYEISTEKLRKIPPMIRGIIESQPDTRFDRSHFKDFGDFSLNFETVYYVLHADYLKYADIQQEINLKIKDAFEKEGIAFAYPTAVQLQKEIN